MERSENELIQQPTKMKNTRKRQKVRKTKKKKKKKRRYDGYYDIYFFFIRLNGEKELGDMLPVIPKRKHL